MTAEIALLNREAIALAADSAVTIRTGAGIKILPSANKIFTLSKYHPVGAMVYGNAHIMGAPWETLIKSYRKHLGTKSFPTLKEYAEDLIRYLSDAKPFFSDEMQRAYFIKTVRESFEGMRAEVLEEVERSLSEKGELTEEEIAAIISSVILQVHDVWKEVEYPKGQPGDLPERLRVKFEDTLVGLIDSTFERLPLSADLRTKLHDLAIWLTCKLTPRPFSEAESGLVVAGFGETDVYPSLQSYRVEGVLENELIYAPDRDADLRKGGAAILPFAQSDMVYSFMEGVDSAYQGIIEQELGKVLINFANVASQESGLAGKQQTEFQQSLTAMARDVLKQFREQSQRYRRQNFASQAINMTSMLPKDELAAIAESLVNLTAFRRRMSLEAETVGGPVDVAVISKGDGFIWIKRKHYFSKELNPHFVHNYFREL